MGAEERAKDEVDGRGGAVDEDERLIAVDKEARGTEDTERRGSGRVKGLAPRVSSSRYSYDFLSALLSRGTITHTCSVFLVDFSVAFVTSTSPENSMLTSASCSNVSTDRATGPGDGKDDSGELGGVNSGASLPVGGVNSGSTAKGENLRSAGRVGSPVV